MGENTAPPAPAGNGEVPGQPFYDKTRQHLKELLHKKRLLERNLSLQEDNIFRKETEYLEETPSGNIITGFEAYTKGTGAASGAARRRGGLNDGSRVFSRSSISFNPAAVSS
jgi:chromatin modification-related protein EAF6